MLRRWPLIALLFCTSAAWGAHLLGLRINLSPSEPRGVYRVIGVPPTRDSLVGICLPLHLARVARERGYLAPGDCPGGVQAAIKRIVAIGGDVIDVSASGIRINDRPIPNSAPAERDTRGRSLAHASWGRHALAAGEVWLLGTSDRRSWDSRYFGALSAVHIRATLQPVLTVN